MEIEDTGVSSSADDCLVELTTTMSISTHGEDLYSNDRKGGSAERAPSLSIAAPMTATTAIAAVAFAAQHLTIQMNDSFANPSSMGSTTATAAVGAYAAAGEEREGQHLVPLISHPLLRAPRYLP